MLSSTSLLSSSTPQNPFPLHSTQLPQFFTPNFSSSIESSYQLYCASIRGTAVCKLSARSNVDSEDGFGRRLWDVMRSSEVVRIDCGEASAGTLVERNLSKGK